MKRDITLYSIALIAALALAYWTSLPEETSKADVVEWVNLHENGITKITLKNAQKIVVAERLGDKFWIDITSPNKNDDSEDGKGKDKSDNIRFRANEKFDQLLTKFSPLEVLRVVGDFDEKRAEEFGLTGDDVSTISVKHRSGLFEMKMGRKAYSTSKRFVLDVEKNKVLLIEGRDLDRLSKAKSRLYERSLFNFDWDDVTAAALKAGDLTKELDHTKRNEDGVLGWSVKQENSKNKTLYQTWFDKIDKLKVKAYLADEKQEGLKQVAPFLQVTFNLSNGERENLFFVKDSTAKPVAYYARSNHLGAFVKVSNARMDTLEKDIAPVMGE